MRIAVFGEVMLELSGNNPDAMRLGFGGDTLNTAFYLARLGRRPTYITALGQDPYSDRMISGFAADGIDTSLILRHPERMPGLYAIETDASGERRFHYWRGQSAARDFFSLPDSGAAMDRATEAELLYFSGISISILGEDDRYRLLDLASAVRSRGGKVAFDPNFRPKGWGDPDVAGKLFEQLAPSITWLLTTDADEDMLFGAATPEEHLSRWLDWGVGEAVLKAGPTGAWLPGGENIPASKPDRIVDTTGAGDSFNAAWLHARLEGKSAGEAAEAGNRLAARVIGFPGAIAPQAVA